MYEVKSIGDNQLKAVFPVMQVLRPALDLAEFVGRYRAAHAAGFRLAGVHQEDQWIAVMGYRIVTDFAFGRHIYIDDLVTLPEFRSQGCGAQLLAHAESVAKKLGIGCLRLCSGLQREDAHRFYAREGWDKRSFAFIKTFS